MVLMISARQWGPCRVCHERLWSSVLLVFLIHHLALLMFVVQASSSSSSLASSSNSWASMLALRVGQRLDDSLFRKSSPGMTTLTTSSYAGQGVLSRRRTPLTTRPEATLTTGTSKLSSGVSSSADCTLATRKAGTRELTRPRGGGNAARKKTTPLKIMTRRRKETLNLLSGGLAGTVAACITNPLEVIKTQLQSSNSFSSAGRGNAMSVCKAIIKQDGASGFYRGLPPTLVGIIPARSVYFYAYQSLKKWLGPYLPEGGPRNALVAGFCAGICSNTITNPIWMVRTRMQLLADPAAGQRTYTNYGDAIATIIKDEGLNGFFKGIGASYWGCIEGSIQFLLYEQFKSRLLKRRNNSRAGMGLAPIKELSRAEYFWSAAAAKMVASIVSYPHEVARTRLREQARSGVFKYTGMWQTIALVAREEGTAGIYGGMGMHLVKVVPNSAFMFLTYEIVRDWLSTYTIVDEHGKVTV